MNQEGRIFNIPKNDGSLCWNIGRELNDLARKILDGGNRSIEWLIILDYFFFYDGNFTLKIRVFSSNLDEGKSFLALQNGSCATIRHLDELDDLGHGPNGYKISDAGILNIAVFLGEHTYQFVSLIRLRNGLDRLIPSNRYRYNNAWEKDSISQWQQRQFTWNQRIIGTIPLIFIKWYNGHEVNLILLL